MPDFKEPAVSEYPFNKFVPPVKIIRTKCCFTVLFCLFVFLNLGSCQTIVYSQGGAVLRVKIRSTVRLRPQCGSKAAGTCASHFRKGTSFSNVSNKVKK